MWRATVTPGWGASSRREHLSGNLNSEEKRASPRSGEQTVRARTLSRGPSCEDGHGFTVRSRRVATHHVWPRGAGDVTCVTEEVKVMFSFD